MKKNQINFKGKKVATTYGFSSFLKEQIVKSGGILLGEDAYFKDVDLFIITIGDITFKLAMFLQHTQVEFYFLEEVIDSLGGAKLYENLKSKKEKESYFIGSTTNLVEIIKLAKKV